MNTASFRLSRPVFPLLCLLLLVGCGAQPVASLLTDYRERVENLAGLEGRPVPPDLQIYPSHRQRTLSTARQRVGFVDFLRLYDCEVFGLLGERNSILGKVMPVSRQLAYELRFLDAARRCLVRRRAGNDPDPALLAKLEAAVAVKRRDLARVLWNASFDSEEMQKTFSLAASPLTPGEGQDLQAALGALAYFQDLALKLEEPGFVADIKELESHNQTLRERPVGGRLFQSLALIGQELGRAAQVLETRLARTDGCPGPGRQWDAVYRDSLTARVRPYLDQVRSQGRDWLAAIDRLIEAQQVTPPPAFAAYRRRMLSLEGEQGLWRETWRAVARHDAAWRALRRRCGLASPGVRV